MSFRVTGALPTECGACHGLGYTPATAAEMECRHERGLGDVEVRTIRQEGRPLVGSGCPKCHGTGQLDSKPQVQPVRETAQIRRLS